MAVKGADLTGCWIETEREAINQFVNQFGSFRAAKLGRFTPAAGGGHYKDINASFARAHAMTAFECNVGPVHQSVTDDGGKF